MEFLNSPEGEERRQLLARKIAVLSEQLPDPPVGARPAQQESAIFPWIVGDEQATLDLSQALLQKGFLVPAIRYPTVPKGKARLRITVTAAHEEEQIDALGKALRNLPTP